MRLLWLLCLYCAACAPERDPPRGGPTSAPPSGGGAGDGEPGCGAIEQAGSTSLQGADIIVALDTSGSMIEEQAMTEAALNDFAETISEAGVDARLIMLGEVCIAPPLGSGGCPGDSMPPAYVHSPAAIGSHDALSAIVDRFPEYAGFLRHGAPKHLLIISDDDAMPPAIADALDFIDTFTALDPALLDGFVGHAVYCFQPGGACVSKGTVYDQLVWLTGGVAGDLAKQAFAPIFDTIADDVVVTSEPLPCSFAIGKPPKDVEIDYDAATVTFVDGYHVPHALPRAAAPCSEGWYYDDDDAPAEIRLCPESCALVTGDPAGRVEIALPCLEPTTPG